ncbi:E3 ubiquitin-protein ligase UBR4-like isoform X2 [Dreissena polymorpha]|uniref:E3 ubiquitin-protein ligase UBR4-like isoform X2 n=1 Tax=Dreissena polymorpha TaxID=45954 RepID=UPI002264A1D3|nr:E3 ubiquitin-protein ligase UBR4-like isoform X2 [Dreissena polymorpha]
MEPLQSCLWMKAPPKRDPTDLLTLPTPTPVQQHTRALLASLFTNRTVYFAQKDETELLSVIMSLTGEGDAPVMDVDAFQRLLVTSRSVAVSRPTNLVKFAEQTTHRNRDTQKQDEKEVLKVVDLEKPEPTPAIVGHLEGSERCHFVSQMMPAFWRLLAARHANPMLAPVCLPGLAHVVATVCAIIEIIHTFTVSDLDHVIFASKLYARLLLDRDLFVSFACKQALIRALRPRARRKRVFIQSPPQCHSPEEGEVKDSKPEATAVQSLPICEAPDNNEEEDMDMEIVLKKIGDSVSSVAEYLMTQRTPFIKKLVRKLLLFICGTKEKYQELQDLHSIELNLRSVTSQCQKSWLSAGDVAPTAFFSRMTLLVLIEHLKVCSDSASSRPIHWQKYCLEHQEVLLFLVRSNISLYKG